MSPVTQNSAPLILGEAPPIVCDSYAYPKTT